MIMRNSIVAKSYLQFFSKKNQTQGYTKVQLIGLILGPLLFVLFNFLIQLEGLSPSARFVLASTLWIAT